MLRPALLRRRLLRLRQCRSVFWTLLIKFTGHHEQNPPKTANNYPKQTESYEGCGRRRIEIPSLKTPLLAHDDPKP